MNPILRQALLASLPLLGAAVDLRSGVLYGGVGVTIFLVSTFIFFVLRPVIPDQFYRLSFILLIFLLGLSGIEWLKKGLGYSAFLLPASLCILTPPDFFRRPRNWKRLMGKNLASGFYFWILLAGHGTLSEFLGKELGVHLAQHPAGSFFLLGLAMTLLPERFKR